MLTRYDIIVVGAGHAGCEAASAAATLGSKTLLITMDMTKMAHMSCNPAMGGIAKGQIVREIDAMGGYSGIVTDTTTIQFRMLNRSKGPAMWSPRAQCDRMLFSTEWRKILEQNTNIDFWQDSVTELVIEKNKIKGVKTQLGLTINSKAVILTNGTFLNGLMHVGKVKIEGGRAAELPSKGLTQQLKKIGFEIGRMKTGTPLRIDGRTIDFSKMTEQEGDLDPTGFSFLTKPGYLKKQKSCYITYTNEKVHQILKSGLKDSPLYNGTIQSIGPRYCPSIETKIITFADKDKHQLFLEPEGWDTNEYYLNGFSSSLPWYIQIKAMNQVKGLEKAKIFRPGYAIEYDYFDPTQLYHTMETKQIENLFFAGQINGTTGYEEAAAQGIIAGINARHKLSRIPEFIIKRDEAYIGVLIDDLVTKGVDEPYRMFTSRAEYRILLRQDNADERLTEKAFQIGLVTQERINKLKLKANFIQELINFCKKYSIEPKIINPLLKKQKTSLITQKVKLIDLISRPQINIFSLLKPIKELKSLTDQFKQNKNEIIESAEIEIKYTGYIEKEKQLAEKSKRLENIKINSKIDYSKLISLSTEARQKLTKIKPETIGQASRISGVSPADINVLLVYMKR